MPSLTLVIYGLDPHKPKSGEIENENSPLDNVLDEVADFLGFSNPQPWPLDPALTQILGKNIYTHIIYGSHKGYHIQLMPKRRPRQEEYPPSELEITVTSQNGEQPLDFLELLENMRRLMEAKGKIRHPEHWYKNKDGEYVMVEANWTLDNVSIRPHSEQDRLSLLQNTDKILFYDPRDFLWKFFGPTDSYGPDGNEIPFSRESNLSLDQKVLDLARQEKLPPNYDLTKPLCEQLGKLTEIKE